MQVKKLWKVFIFLFLVTFVIFNWNEVSWIFNYRAVSGLLSDFFKESDNKIEAIYSYNGSDNEQGGGKYEYYEKKDSLEIPKIDVFAPLIFTKTADPKEIGKSLNLGVVHFFNSVLFGQAGQTIILGHSAPPGWPKIRYDGIFSRLNELSEGDKVFVFFNNRKYEYSVTGKIFLEKGEEIPEHLTNSENVLILITCWPPGQDVWRLAIVAK